MNSSWSIITQDSTLYLGGYAFYWGNKYERTNTFYSLFTEEGYETEAVNILKSKWSGAFPKNWAPRIDSLHINSKKNQDNLYLVAGSILQAQAFAYDSDNDSLTYRWEIRPEGRDNFRKGDYDLEMSSSLLLLNEGAKIQFQAPKQEGGYRLFSFVYDGKQHVATHNIPFYITVQ